MSNNQDSSKPIKDVIEEIAKSIKPIKFDFPEIDTSLLYTNPHDDILKNLASYNLGDITPIGEILERQLEEITKLRQIVDSLNNRINQLETESTHKEQRDKRFQILLGISTTIFGAVLALLATWFFQ